MFDLRTDLGLYTDFYELTMAQGYFLENKTNEKVTFDYFFRSNSFNGGFMVFAGISDFIESLSKVTFSTEALEYLNQCGFCDDFLNYLKEFKFKGSIISVKEGEIVFPYEPLIRVEGNIIEVQIIETLLLNVVNYETLIATKAYRTKLAIGDRIFNDFGLRRAQSFGGIHGSKATIIGGANNSSNTYASFKYDIPVSGTMAHSWIESFDSEEAAFRAYAKIYKEKTIFLVDTYNTLKSGIPNSIKIAKELEKEGCKAFGIRLDSGDLSYLSKQARKMLDEAGLDYLKIIISNQLNEFVIRSLNDQGAPIDGFGVGTELITAKPESALSGVYKLSEIEGRPKMKISENLEKVSFPGRKKVIRIFDKEGNFYRDGIILDSEDPKSLDKVYHPYQEKKFTEITGLHYEELMIPIMERGEVIYKFPSPIEANAYLMERTKHLAIEHKRFISPHIYKVGLSKKLKDLRDKLYEDIQKRHI